MKNSVRYVESSPTNSMTKAVFAFHASLAKQATTAWHVAAVFEKINHTGNSVLRVVTIDGYLVTLMKSKSISHTERG